jgi:putative addiction module CopG family antidote
MHISLTPEQEALIARMMQSGQFSSGEEVIDAALHRLEDEEAERWRDTLEALEDVKAGRLIDGERVDAWLASWGTEHELEPPR